MAKVLVALMIVSTAALADEIAPGSWQISMQTRVPTEPSFAPPAFQITQCFTPEDARDPSRILGGISNPGATGCKYTDESFAGNSFSFTMQCEGSYAIQASGHVSFTSSTMEGTIESTANVAGKPVQTQNKLTARRLGGC
ncbi:MAG TPA: DUF3617 family protein [Burkholderiales bacterium]|nr:DUF3617 family protein [Burkholderiales bacterium]